MRSRCTRPPLSAPLARSTPSCCTCKLSRTTRSCGLTRRRYWRRPSLVKGSGCGSARRILRCTTTRSSSRGRRAPHQLSSRSSWSATRSANRLSTVCPGLTCAGSMLSRPRPGVALAGATCCGGACSGDATAAARIARAARAASRLPCGCACCGVWLLQCMPCTAARGEWSRICMLL